MATDHSEISKREAEVLAALGGRLTNAEIAAMLHISTRTVESHVSSLLRKLGAADRRALSALAGTALPGGISGLPDQRTSFVGRHRERVSVTDALGDARLVTLLGPGGVGKTRLATVVAGEAAPGFSAGGAFVDLVPAREGFVAQAVATVLGVVEQPRQPLTDAIAERLGRGRALLVLDNCEHVADAASAVVELILSRCPGTTVLATSRERLGVAGERVVPVAPLPLASDAQTLFYQRALAANPEFVADPTVVAALCARLDGIALAIELAAARSASLGAAALLAALDGSLRLLAANRGAERHRSMHAVIGWSHELLDAEEKAVFCRLAAFVGGFDLDAAVAVQPGRDRAVVADVLSRLVDKSLVVFRLGANSSSRWRLLETVRAFAMQQLVASGELDDVHRRYLRWAVATGVDLESRVGSDDAWRGRFDMVADDLRAAVTVAPPGPGAAAHRLARALGHLCYARRFLLESLDHYQEAARRAQSPGEAARDLRSAADGAHATTTSGHAFALLLASAVQARTAGDGDAESIGLAYAVTSANRFPAGFFPAEIPHERLCELLERAAAVGDQDDPVVAAHLAAARAWNKHPEKITPDPALAREAVAAARATGDPVLICSALDALGTAEADAGHLRTAHRISGEQFALIADMPRDAPYSAAEIVDTFHVASTRAIMTGDLPAAMTIARLAVRDDLIGNHPYMSTSKLITPLVLTGAFDEALRHAATMWDGWVRAGSPPAGWMASTISAIALAHGLLGDRERFHLWRARATHVAGAARNLASFAAFVDANVAIHTGPLDDAPTLVAQAFADFPGGQHTTYARAAGAELAVIAGLPQAADLVRTATPTCAENHWAVACLARATARLHGNNPDELRACAGKWDRLGADFERARTLQTVPPL